MIIFAVMGAMLIAGFLALLLETSWMSVRLDKIIAHENGHGPTRATLAIRTLLKERMTIVLSFTFAGELILFYPAMKIEELAGGVEGVIVRIAITVFPIIFFVIAEMGGKFTGYRYATEIALASAIPLRFFFGVLFRITWLTRIMSWFTGGKDLRLTREEDVLATVQLAEEHGALHPVEGIGIKQWLIAGNKTVRDFLIPLDQCTRVMSLRPTRRELRNAARKHSEIVVCPEEGTVTGILVVEDLIELLNGEMDGVVGIAKRVRSVPDIPATTPIPEALLLLKEEPVGVVTERGRPIGIFVVNDILDAIREAISEGD